MKTLVVSASPREDGNSHALARSAIDGARDLGARLFDIRVTDYRLDTARSNRVWDQPA